MYNLLKGKKGIIFGALDENSIAWKTAERVHEEGGEFVLTNAPVAMRMGTINDLAKQTSSLVIPADATRVEDLENLIQILKDNSIKNIKLPVSAPFHCDLMNKATKIMTEELNNLCHC